MRRSAPAPWGTGYRVTARVGYGWSWIDKRRTFPDGRPGVDRAIGLLSASVNPIRTLTIGVNAQRSLQHSPAYGYFVQSMVGAEVSQQFPLGITASASASYDVQEPRRGPIRRTQHYLLSVGWVPRELDFLEISLQSGYDYSRTRASHFEVFHAAAVVTLRL